MRALVTCPTLIHGRRSSLHENTEYALIRQLGFLHKPSLPRTHLALFVAGPFEAAGTNQSLGVTVPLESERFVGYGSFPRVLDTLEAAVRDRSLLAGERFSAADVYVGAQIGFGLLFGTIEKRPAFVRYFENLSLRPACLRAAQLDGFSLKTGTSA